LEKFIKAVPILSKNFTDVDELLSISSYLRKIVLATEIEKDQSPDVEYILL
jgi:hypothetical protein